MKIVFMGTSRFAEIVLKRIASWKREAISAVYCRPDMPSSRGRKILPPPVKIVASEIGGIPILQPINFKEDSEIEKLRSFAPDIIAVASYGVILPQAVLDIPKIAPINVHASLLPLYRGAAPIERAIMDGCTHTGITIMKIEKKLDSGPIYSQRAMGIDLNDTAGDLHTQLAELGAEMLIETFEMAESGNLPAPIPQTDTLATYAEKISKNEENPVWNKTAESMHAYLRALTPNPGVNVLFDIDGRIISAKLLPSCLGAGFFEPFNESTHPLCGTVAGVVRGCLAIACIDAFLLVSQICPSGKKFMDAKSFVNGYIKGASSVKIVSSNI